MSARSRPRVVWMFSGQGSQYPGMGRALFESNAVFRGTMEECDRILAPLIETSLLDLLYSSAEPAPSLERTLHSHPALLALQYSLARTLLAAGGEPDALLGYSLGELVAAVVGGAITLEAGLALAVEHARVTDRECESGAMLAAIAAPSILLQMSDALEDCWLAAVNAPAHFVVSGRRQPVLELQARLEAAGIATALLPVATAFHSALLDPAMPALLAGAHARAIRPLRWPCYSARNAGPLATLDPAFFAHVARAPIDFPATLQRIESAGPCLYLDLGPSGTLANFIKYASARNAPTRCLEIMTPFGHDIRNLEHTLAALAAHPPRLNPVSASR